MTQPEPPLNSPGELWGESEADTAGLFADRLHSTADVIPAVQIRRDVNFDPIFSRLAETT